MDAFLKSLALGIRLLRRNPGFAAVVLGTLAVAVGATLTTVSIVDAWLFKPLAFPEPDRLVVAFGATRDRPTEPAVWLPYRTYLGWKQQSRSFDGVSGAFMREGALVRGGRAETVLGLSVTPDFFQTLAVPLRTGRAFDERDTATGEPVAILNARAAQRLFGSESAAIGRRVRLGEGPWREVVGVVANVRSSFFNTLEWLTTPIVYRPAAQAFAGSLDPAATSFAFQLHIRSDRQVTLAELRDAVVAVDPRAAVGELSPVPLLIDEATRQPSFRTTLLFWFSAASLLLAAIGVYGVVAQGVTQRLREIAIRLAIGAQPGRVTREVAGHALLAGAGGVLVGGVVIALAARWLQAVLYGVQPTDAGSFAAAAAVLLGVTLAAALIPARRASRVQPVTILRGD